jgi:hypothetical protein
MKKRVYIETTVVSYLTARKSGNPVVAGHQESTRMFWKQLARLSPFISDLVLQEVERGHPVQAKARLDALINVPVLRIESNARALTERLITEHAVPEEYPEDAVHIAVATVNGMDFLVTWNMAHINNPFTRMMIRQVAENAGYVAPEICTPEELFGGEP